MSRKGYLLSDESMDKEEEAKITSNLKTYLNRAD